MRNLLNLPPMLDRAEPRRQELYSFDGAAREVFEAKV